MRLSGDLPDSHASPRHESDGRRGSEHGARLLPLAHRTRAARKPAADRPRLYAVSTIPWNPRGSSGNMAAIRRSSASPSAPCGTSQFITTNTCASTGIENWASRSSSMPARTGTIRHSRLSTLHIHACVELRALQPDPYDELGHQCAAGAFPEVEDSVGGKRPRLDSFPHATPRP